MKIDRKRRNLEVYLRDHYAGGVGALELLAHLADRHQGELLGSFFSRLQTEVKIDHDELHRLMQALGLDDSTVRNASAWLAEKFGRLKVGLPDGEDASLQILQSLEALALGVTGKMLLWRALSEVRDLSPTVTIDLARMEARAVEQIASIETQRMAIAQAAFDGSGAERNANT